jgi:hypothetical protein
MTPQAHWNAILIQTLFFLALASATVLAGLWVALSHGHRIGRLVAFLSLPAAMYLAQAKELVIWVSIVLTVSVSFGLIGRWAVQARFAGPIRGLPKPQFRLGDVFFATSVVAIGLAGVEAVRRMDWTGNRQAMPVPWMLEALAVACTGVTAAYFALGQRRSTLRAVSSILVVVSIGIAASCYAEPLSLAFQIISDWPDLQTEQVWVATLPWMLFCVVAPNLWLWQFGQRLRTPRVVLAIAIIAPVAYLWYELVRPISIPASSPPDPNGYERLVSIAGQIDDANLWPTMPPTFQPTEAQLRAFRQKNAAVLTEARLALDLPAQVPVPYHGYDTPPLQSLRVLARSFSALGKAAIADKAYDEAVAVYLDELRLSERMTRGGTMSDLLPAGSFESLGIRGLTTLVPELTATKSRALKELLLAHDRRREPLADVLRRDDALNRLSHGWRGRWSSTVGYLADSGRPYRHVVDVLNRRRAELRVLVCDLAIHTYQLERRQLPERLDDLVPGFVAAVPTDPFDGQAIRYRKGAEQYVIYSVGRNQRDDGGNPDRQDGDCGVIARSIPVKSN